MGVVALGEAARGERGAAVGGLAEVDLLVVVAEEVLLALHRALADLAVLAGLRRQVLLGDLGRRAVLLVLLQEVVVLVLDRDGGAARAAATAGGLLLLRRRDLLQRDGLLLRARAPGRGVVLHGGVHGRRLLLRLVEVEGRRRQLLRVLLLVLEADLRDRALVDVAARLARHLRLYLELVEVRVALEDVDQLARLVLVETGEALVHVDGEGKALDVRARRVQRREVLEVRVRIVDRVLHGKQVARRRDPADHVAHVRVDLVALRVVLRLRVREVQLLPRLVDLLRRLVDDVRRVQRLPVTDHLVVEPLDLLLLVQNLLNHDRVPLVAVLLDPDGLLHYCRRADRKLI